MALTASQLCALSRSIARVPNYAPQSGMLLNSILSDLCQKQDFDAAKHVFNFVFTPATAAIGNLNAQLASGPFRLPPDYLRTKINDVLYFPSGLANFPLRLTPIDLDEFDGLVQQAGFQNFPVFWVTDMSQAGPMLTATGTTHGNTTLDVPAATALSLSVGMSAMGPGLVAPGVRITAVGSTSVTLASAATSSTTGGFVFANPPIAYVWPPASGQFPCMVRYYAQMPDIITPESSSVVPWFISQEYLRRRLAADLMEITNDERWAAFDGAANDLMRGFLIMKDDDTNRSKRVTLDPRRFGPAWDRLPKSKKFGY